MINGLRWKDVCAELTHVNQLLRVPERDRITREVGEGEGEGGVQLAIILFKESSKTDQLI